MCQDLERSRSTKNMHMPNAVMALRTSYIDHLRIVVEGRVMMMMMMMMMIVAGLFY